MEGRKKKGRDGGREAEREEGMDRKMCPHGFMYIAPWFGGNKNNYRHV